MAIGNLYRHLDWGFLEYAGIKPLWELSREKEVLHLELPPSKSCAFIETLPKNRGGRASHSEYRFGVWDFCLPDDPDEGDLSLARHQIESIQFLEPIRKAGELPHILTGLLLKQGYEKMLKNYYSYHYPILG